MTLSIRDPEADRLARELAQIAGESITEAVGKAVSERLERIRRENDFADRKAEIEAITHRFRQNLTGLLQRNSLLCPSPPRSPTSWVLARPRCCGGEDFPD